MKRPLPSVSPRRRASRAVAAAALLAIAGAGCTSVDLNRVAATVDGEEILVADLEPRAEALAAQINDASQAFSDVLGGAVQDAALRAVMDDLGVVASDQEVQDAIDFAAASGGLTTEEFLQQQAEQQGRDADDLFAAARFQVQITKYQDDVFASIEVDDAEVEALYDERLPQLLQADVSHILVPTEPQAEDVLERLDDGEDFADVAEEVSQDPGSAANGGRLGLAPVSTYVPEFAQASATAPIGEVVGPVETQFGFHLIRVDERIEPSLDDVYDQLRDEIAGQRFQPLLLDSLREALAQVDIDVNSRFGRWDPSAGQIGGVVPAGPLEGRG